MALVVPPPSAPTLTVQERCILIAEGEIGVREATGNNDGKEVEEYLASCSLGPGYPWCSCFIHWVYRQGGRTFQPQREFAAARKWDERAVWNKATSHWQRNDTARISRNGELFTLWYDALGRIGHVGMIIDEDAKWITTIEGNTGNGGEREGEGVYKRKRMKSTLYSICRWL